MNSNGNVVGLQVAPGIITVNASTTAASVHILEVATPTISLAGSGGTLAVVTEASTLYIQNAPTASAAGNNYALFVDAGTSRFDGIAQIRAGNGLQLYNGADSAYVTLNFNGTSMVSNYQIQTPSITSAGDLNFTPAANFIITPGTAVLVGGSKHIGSSGVRVAKIWTIDQDTTNAENVSSWSALKHNDVAYTKSALDILRATEVITFEHNDDIDPSGRVKLGVRAESIHEPLAAPLRDYERGYGVGPGVDMMGLAALNTKAIQELEARLTAIGA